MAGPPELDRLQMWGLSGQWASLPGATQNKIYLPDGIGGPRLWSVLERGLGRRGVNVVRGRAFMPTDVTESEAVAIINQRMGLDLFGSDDRSAGASRSD